MRKKVGIIKRVLCLALIFLLSINSFAAIVSDNDGSAFITKVEFDSLKNSFQSQIDQYNQSIDSKIDGAIASYLSGIKLSTTHAQTIPWSSNQVTFGEIRNIDLGTHDPIIYLPTWKNKYGTRLAEMIGSHTAAYTTSNLQK